MNLSNKKRIALALAAAASTVTSALVNQAFAGTTTQPSSGSPKYNEPVAGDSNGNQYATISLSGSTAMRNFTTSVGISYLPSSTQIFLSSGTFQNTSASGTALQLEPVTPAATSNASGVTDVPAIRQEWHEQGSVEGILEMASDQIGFPTNYVPPPSLITRSPSAPNPTWVNHTSYAAPVTASSTAFAIDNFSSTSTPNAQQQSPVQMAISDVKPLQAFAFTTSLPGAPTSTPANPWNVLPGQAGYGMGNPAAALNSATNTGLGVSGAREQLQNQTVLNMPTSQINPATGTNYTAGPWNSGGVTNLQTNTVGITATDFAANPGTGLIELNQNDAQWLQLTGRLMNGATFQMSTRDTNSGTRNTAANNTGIDPSWAVGVNDNGDTNIDPTTQAVSAADPQYQIGHDANGNATIRFSGKTSGGNLRMAVQNSRMAVGTLSLPDSLAQNQGSLPAPIQVLAYNPNGTDQTASNFIMPTAQTIINGTYTIWQQEQYVTVKTPGAGFAADSAAQWAATTDLQTGIKGDTANTSIPLTASVVLGVDQIGGTAASMGGFVVGQSINSAAFPAGTLVTGIHYNESTDAPDYITVSNPANVTGTISDLTVSGGDVANFRANVLNAQLIAGSPQGYLTVLNPGDQLIAKGFILPQFMAVQKSYDGGPVTANPAFDINTNPLGYNQSLSNAFLSNSLATASNSPFLPVEANTNGTIKTSGIITTPTDGAAGGYYGQAARGASKLSNGVVVVAAANNVDFTNGDIAVTPSNYLFGNFNNNGIRDYSSFQTGFAVLKALYDSGFGVDVNDTTAFNAVTATLNGGSASDNSLIPNSVLNLVDPGLASILGSSSTFIGQQGPSAPITNPANALPAVAAFTTGITKGDAIMMGDYDGSGRFDGLNLYTMAIGTTLSETTSTNSLTSMNDVRTGVLRKNSALDFVQSGTTDATYDSNGNALNASAFIRQSATTVLTGASVSAGATQLYAPASGGSSVYGYTYDPQGANAFNKSDVNRDGVVDFNDAVEVDNFNGQSYTSLSNVLSATAPAPVTGASQTANLVLVQQIDGEAAIGSADLGVLNTQLTGVGNANWYGYNVQKTGPGTITYARTGGTVNVYSGASFEISGGTVQVGGTLDPFSDNSGNSTNHVAVAVDHGSKLSFTGAAGSVSTVSGLTIDTASGSKVDIGSTTLKIDFTGSDPAATIHAYLASGYAGGSWTGTGLTSSVVAAQAAANKGTLNKIYSIGYVDGNTDGSAAIAAGVGANQILIEPELAADANVDGQVNFSDLVTLAQNFGSTTGDWVHGDFNYDSIVNFQDLVILAQNFGATNGNTLLAAELPAAFQAQWQLAQAEVSAANGSSVPEPGSLSLAAIGAVGLLARRRRRNA